MGTMLACIPSHARRRMTGLTSPQDDPEWRTARLPELVTERSAAPLRASHVPSLRRPDVRTRSPRSGSDRYHRVGSAALVVVLPVACSGLDLAEQERSR